MALASTLANRSQNATHYLKVELSKRIRGGILSSWVDMSKVMIVIGNHSFFNPQG
jgi:hypothetical protein